MMVNTVTGGSHNASLLRMFKGDSSTLSLRYVKDKKSVEGLADFLVRDSVRVVNLVEPSHASIFVHVLEELAKVHNCIEVLHLDLWSNGAPELIQLLGNAFRANKDSLLEISLKCRFGAKFVADLIPFLPTNLEVLDLSENILSDKVFLEPLMDFIRCSELHVLRLANCAIKSEVVDAFVSILTSNHSAISLEALEGLDLASCTEIPKNIRTSLKDPPSKTRKDQMGYNGVGQPPQRDAAVQFLDYLKNSLLMHRLVGCRVRVWWPATSDENRSGFAGRFWPAKVLRVNPIDMIFVVEYDNQEIDRVPCKFIQPEAPFLYGGGVNTNFLKSMFGVKYFTALSNALASRSQPLSIIQPLPSSSLEGDNVTQMVPAGMDAMNPMGGHMDPSMNMHKPMDSCDASYFCGTQNGAWPVQMANGSATMGAMNGATTNGGTMIRGDSISSANSASLRSSSAQKRIPTAPPEAAEKPTTQTGKRGHQKDKNAESEDTKTNTKASNAKSKNTDISNSNRTKSEGSGNQGSYNKKAKTNKDAPEPEPEPEPVKHDFIPKMLQQLTLSSNRRYCNVFFPRDLTHISTDCHINVETILGLDASYSGNVLQPGDVCEFRDPLDTDGSDPSDYIGVIKEVNTKEPLYKVICVYQDDEDEVELDSIDVRRLTMIPWYSWVSLVMAVERHALLSKRLSESQLFYTTISECLLCVKKRDPIHPFKGTPPNPLEMPVQLMQEYADEVKAFPTSHPRLTAVQQQRTADPESTEALRFQLRKQQQKIDALLEIYEAVRLELEKERDLNVDLQSKLNCVVCFEKRINCFLGPCGHFSFCKGCADSFSNCPICRRRIVRRQVLRVD